MKNFRKTMLAVALYTAIAPTSLGLAEDIDIYAANTSEASNPNILVIIDNSANWASNAQHWPDSKKQGESELSALRTVISELDDSVNLGLMMFTAGGGSNEDGGYVRFHMREMNATNKAAFQELLGNPAGCTDGANSLNLTPNCIYQNFSGGALNESVGTAKTDYSATMFEAFKYFGGYTSPANATTDTAGSPVDASHFGALRYAGDPETRSDFAAYSNDANKTSYNSPLSNVNSCAKNFVIFIGNGYPTQDSASTLLTGIGGNATQMAVPDFVTTSGTVTTLISTGAYASQAACEAAAAAAHGTDYDSYSCSVAGSSTVSTTLDANTGCGVYESAAACEAAAATTYGAAYSSYTCNPNGVSCVGATTNLGVSTCGQYASIAACETGAAASHAGFSSYSCTVNNPACGASTDNLGISTCGEYATANACQTALASRFPGYSSYSCSLNSACTTAFSSNACFASANSCQSTALTANPGYSSFSCSSGSNTPCNGIHTVCGDTNTYNNTSKCDEGGAALLPGYGSYSCASTTTATCGGGNNRQWTITGISANQRYSTITGNGSRWNMSGSTTGGATYNMTGHGGSAYEVLGNALTTTYNVYGEKVVTSASSTGTFSGTSGNYADEWARFLYQTDLNAATGQQNATTYAIDVFKDAQDANETKLLMSMARAGGGKYFSASDEGAIRDALRRIFAEIQSVNSVFASSSLPVSVNTQGTYLNQVFMGMFRPDGGAKPRWAGNLKQYHFKIFDGILRLADKNDAEAISSTTGFITPCAESFWSTDTGNYWNFSGSNAVGGCNAVTSDYPAAGSSSMYSDSPDGDVVEKGGAAQRLRGVTLSGGAIQTSQNYSTRVLKTCDGSSATSCTAFTNFNSANAALTAATFGISAGTEANFIDWVRGKDVLDEDADTVLDEMRPSVHGGVIHSQPAVVDFGGATGAIAFYGGDDGVFHAVDGGQSDTEGTELWGFIAPETFPRLNRLKDNGTTTPLVSFPGVLGSTAPKDYFFDGAIGVYQKLGSTWIFPAMRRGGRALYAFDVTTPASPVLKWRRGCFTNQTTDDSNCSAGWSGIGQTWSKPTLAFLTGYVYPVGHANAGSPKPVLIFGGGYDTCEDTDSQTRCAGTSKGAQVWFVDADTGDIIRTYPVSASSPGDVALITNTGGYVTHVYASDTNGDVYRINVGTYDGTTFSGWSSNAASSNIVIAQLSETNHARKFLNGPDVVAYTGYNAVMLGSGDREHPLIDSYACGSFSSTAGDFVTNQFYMLKDTPNAYPGSAITPAQLTDVTAGTTTVTVDGVTSTVAFTEGLIGAYGWKFNFGECEQAVNRPLTIAGTVYFGTNAPIQTAVSSCQANLGAARGYAVDFLTGNPAEGNVRSAPFLGGGMPPSPVAGVVDVDGTKLPFVIGGVDTTEANASALQGSKVEINPTGKRYRVFWYIQND